MLGLWHVLVKRPLASLLPDRWAQLAVAAELGGTDRPRILLVAVVVGAMTGAALAVTSYALANGPPLRSR